MNLSNRLFVVAAAVSLAAIGTSAIAQTPVMQKSRCVYVGSTPPEPLGDRAGHALQVSTYSCRTEGGAMDGGVMTGTNIYEWDGAKAVLLTGAGVLRKPGATAVYQVTEATTTLVMTDGKVTGFTAAGKGVIKLATGSAASMNGKTYSYTVRPTSPVEFVIESTFD